MSSSDGVLLSLLTTVVVATVALEAERRRRSLIDYIGTFQFSEDRGFSKAYGQQCLRYTDVLSSSDIIA